jgi:hypothetical protein
MRQDLRKTTRRKNGYILVTSSLSILVLLGFVGLAVDVGYLQFEKRRLQAAADAAAQGAAFQLAAHATADATRTEAKYDSAKNGFTDGANGVTVTINLPPTSGNYTSGGYAAEAIVSQAIPTFFMRLFSLNSATVAARGVAQAGNSTGCIYTLNPSAQDSFLESGGATVSIGCGVVVDSSNSKAAECSGGSTKLIASTVSVHGGYNTSGGCSMSPTPTTGVAVVPDPLAYLTAPTVPGTCTKTDYTLNSGTDTISPGTYCGGITVSSSSSTLYVNPGMYILKGGGLTVSGGGNMITNAGGATFYNTGTSSTYGKINISGGSTITLQAPTSSANGGLTGILFFQDRANTLTATFSGGSTMNITGALYFKAATVNYSGGSGGAGQWSIIVSDKVNFSGGSTLGKDFSNYPDGSPIKQGASMVE